MPIIEETCTITAKGQTTVPKAIRPALGVGYGNRIILPVQSGAITVQAAAEPESDQALSPFLALLERDSATRPQVLAPLTPDLVARMEAATHGVTAAEPDAPIDGGVAL